MLSRPKSLQIVAVFAALVLLAAACSSRDSADVAAIGAESTDAQLGQQETVVATIEPAPTFPGPASFDRPSSAIYQRDSPEFPAPLIDLDELLSGGPPPDGITPLDEPAYITVDEVNFLAPQDSVLVLEVNGEAKALPTQIMIWHEIANTEVGGVPITVSYCPLCNSAVAFPRTHADGTVMDFGTSGLLYRSSLVMYDRQTSTLWTHLDGQAVHGVMAGNELDLLPVSTVSFADFAEAHPDGLVLSRDTGLSRQYGINPYSGYDSNGRGGTMYPAEFDDSRAVALARVLAVRSDASIAVFHEFLLEERVVAIELDGVPLVVLLQPGTASALQAGQVALGRDVGATGVFETTVDGRELSFVPIDEGGFTDEQTGSTWNIFGLAVEGELAGTGLQAVEHLDTFWFAIATFRPDTVLVGAG